jgi:small GTP-binding protein
MSYESNEGRIERTRNDMSSQEEADVEAKVKEARDRVVEGLKKKLVIAFVGKVSSGKSSLINAFLRRDRSTVVATVGARSGVTTEIKRFDLDDNVSIIDTPGLSDLKASNSRVTYDALHTIDVGIFVVTGSADQDQKRDFDDLRKRCARTFVVLNKVDAWDDLEEKAVHEVISQWCKELGTERVYPTCAKGYDPSTRADRPMDIRGVDELREDVERFVEAEGKALLLIRVMGEKRSYAAKIIGGAVATTAAEAFLPGAAAIITATQVGVITSLYYVYTGRIISKSSAIALLPTFAAEAVGSTLFLWAKSFLPPTGIVDAAAAAVAATVTGAMLLTVNALLASGSELDEKARIRAKYAELHGSLKDSISNARLEDLRTGAFWQKLIRDLMYA